MQIICTSHQTDNYASNC